MTKQFAFHDLPAASFPFTVEFISERTGAVVHTITADGPGGMTVPALGREHGPVWVRMSFADGKIVEHHPEHQNVR